MKRAVLLAVLGLVAAVLVVGFVVGWHDMTAGLPALLGNVCSGIIVALVIWQLTRPGKLLLCVKEAEEGRTKPDPGARIYRHVEVSNTRRGNPVHNVCVYLRRVAVMDGEGKRDLHRSDIPLEHQWQVNDVTKGRPPKDRTVGAPIVWDLCSIGKATKTVHIHVADEPWNWTPELEPKKTYVLTLQATSNEVFSPEVEIKICWDGEWDDDPSVCAAKHFTVQPGVR